MSEYDAIIIGGGPNGLATAAYLGKAGMKTIVLEKRNILGGGAATLDVKGHKINTAAVYSNALIHKIVDELELTKSFGLKIIRNDPNYTAVYPDGNYLSFWDDPQKACQEISRFSEKDSHAYLEFFQRWSGLAKVLGPTMLNLPLTFNQMVGTMSASPDSLDLLKEMLLGTFAKTLDKTFENDYVKYGFLPLMEGAVSGPHSANPWMLIAHLLLSPHWSVAAGGMGTVGEAYAKAAEHWGATLKTDAAVKSIVVKNGKVVGVKLESGDELFAPIVISSIDIKKTMLEMVGVDLLDSKYIGGVKNVKQDSNGISMGLGLSELPKFNIPEDRLNGTLGFAPSYDYMEKAYYEYHTRQIPKRPAILANLQSYYDPTVAPPGKHTMWLYVWPIPYDLQEGTWKERKAEFFDNVIETLSEYAPNIKGSITAMAGWTPLDLEQELGMPRGDYGHGEWTWDQAFSFRPMIGWANYRTPVENLYLCGVGQHAGPNVAAISAHNAAQEILKDLNSGKKGK